MALDTDFYQYATRFPEGALALVGLRPRGPYKVESIEVKGSRRIDLVFSPEDPDEPRAYVELQARKDPEIERRLLEELVVHAVREGNL